MGYITRYDQISNDYFHRRNAMRVMWTLVQLVQYKSITVHDNSYSG